MPEPEDLIVNPDEAVAQAEAELAELAPDEEQVEEGGEAELGGESETPVVDETPSDVPDQETQDFFSNLQRLTATQEDEFRVYDPDVDSLVDYATEKAAYAARKASSDSFKAQQAFQMMIERVPEAHRNEIRAIVASDEAAMSHPRAVAQAVAAALGLKMLAGTGTKKTTTVAKAPQATRQIGNPGQAPQGSGDREYQSFLKAFGMTSKEMPYAEYKKTGGAR